MNNKENRPSYIRKDGYKEWCRNGVYITNPSNAIISFLIQPIREII